VSGVTSAELGAAASDLRNELAAAAASVPGVARLEPTLLNALRRLHAGTTVLRDGRAVRSAADGIELHRRDAVVDVHVDIVTDRGRSAAHVARDVRAALAEVIAAHALQAGALTVAVLSIEH
jgi:hypothetical protein